MTVLRCSKCRETFEPLIRKGEIQLQCDMCSGLPVSELVVPSRPKRKKMLMSTEPAYTKEEAEQRALEMRKRWREKNTS